MNGRAIVACVCSWAVLAHASPASAEELPEPPEPSRAPDVRAGVGGELMFGENMRASLSGWVSARLKEWLSLGVDFAWGWSGLVTNGAFYTSGNLEKVTPWRVVATGRVLRRWKAIEGSMGLMVGLTAMERVYDIRTETLARVGGGSLMGFAVYPIDQFSIDLDFLFLVSPSPGGRYDAHAGPRLGLSLHLP